MEHQVSKRGIKTRVSNLMIGLKKTHNTTITGEDCNVGVQLTLEDPSVGVVMIKRDYWFERIGGLCGHGINCSN